MKRLIKKINYIKGFCILKSVFFLMTVLALCKGNSAMAQGPVMVKEKAVIGSAALTEVVMPPYMLAQNQTGKASLTEYIKNKCRQLPVITTVSVIDENAPVNILIADVTNYVNVRKTPDVQGEIVGKLYDGCVGIVLSEENGWSYISSGNVKGYVASSYCITGEEAMKRYDDVMQKIAVVEADGLNVRSQPKEDADVIKVLSRDAKVNVLEVLNDWVKIVCSTREGYVAREYVTLDFSYDKAETLEEEKERLRKEEAERKKKEEEARKKAEEERKKAEESKPQQSTVFTEDMTSYDKGLAVAEFALQFVGNPYVWGGTSLTNGADCSGFVLAVYKNFGVKLPHSANADQKQGYAVDGIENAQPGDLICYSGHVGIYIGNNQIVHASTAKTGIKISKATYKTIVAVRRIF